MPAAHDPVTTIEQLLALPEDGLRHELLDGVHVVSPTPRLAHQRAVMALYMVLRPGFETQREFELFSVPGDLKPSPRTVVEPDLFVIQRPSSVDTPWIEAGVPLLAIEILSPGTASRDRGIKRKLYQQAGVAEYWIVDLDARLVERWRSDDLRPEILLDQLHWQLPGGPGGEIDLGRLFQAVMDP
jgi:Uma2 family endonuclease